MQLFHRETPNQLSSEPDKNIEEPLRTNYFKSVTNFATNAICIIHVQLKQ